MKTIIKALSFVVLCAITAGISSCSLVLPQQNDEDEDALCGLFMVFYDGEKAITEEDFSNDEAIKIYFGKHYYTEETDDFYWESVDGRDVFSDVVINYKISKFDDVQTGYDVSITASLRHTEALTKYEMHTYGIYFDEEQRSYYTSDLNVSVNWNGLTGIERSQSIKLCDQSTDGVLYNFEIEINLKEIYDVTQLNIIEFDGENNVVKKSDNSMGTDYQTSEACQYVIVEEISPDGENGNIVHRTLIEKKEEADATFNYYIVDKYGLADNQQFKIYFHG